MQKVLAVSGIDSRRHCEEMILEGRVKVNDEIVRDLPAWVNMDEDKVYLDGNLVNKPRQRKSTGEVIHHYVLLNKPKGTVCTNRDPEGRSLAIDLVTLPGNPRLFCVGRLDAESTGLLLLTTDGDLAHRLTHPRYGVHKTYRLVIRGSLTREEVADLEDGIFMHDRKASGPSKKTLSVKLQFLKRDRERTTLIMELREGRNRQIRRMMARVGHPVKKLERIQLGPLKLKGVAISEWRLLTGPERNSLFKAAKGKSKKKTSKKVNRSTSSE